MYMKYDDKVEKRTNTDSPHFWYNSLGKVWFLDPPKAIYTKKDDVKNWLKGWCKFCFCLSFMKSFLVRTSLKSFLVRTFMFSFFYLFFENLFFQYWRCTPGSLNNVFTQLNSKGAHLVDQTFFFHISSSFIRSHFIIHFLRKK